MYILDKLKHSIFYSVSVCILLILEILYPNNFFLRLSQFVTRWANWGKKKLFADAENYGFDLSYT